MTTSFTVSAKERAHLGSAHTRRLRRLSSDVPAVVYGGGHAPVHIAISANHLSRLLQNEAFFSQILTLAIADKKEEVILKALQRHPLDSAVLHADFLRIDKTHVLTTHVPLHFINEDKAPGVKLGNGVVSHVLNQVEVKCLPADLPEYITVDLGNLALEESLHLLDIKLPRGVESVALLHDNNQLVVTIAKPKLVQTDAPQTEDDTSRENTTESE